MGEKDRILVVNINPITAIFEILDSLRSEYSKSFLLFRLIHLLAIPSRYSFNLQ